MRTLSSVVVVLVLFAAALMGVAAVVATGATSPRSFGACRGLRGAQPAVGGKSLAYVTASGSKLAVARIDGKGARVVYPRDASYPSVSPDGELVAFQRGRNEVWIVRRDGTDAHFVAAGTTPAFSPDGARLAIGGAQTDFDRWELVVVDADGGGRRVVVRDAADFPHPSWSPDGRQIAFVGYVRELIFRTYVGRVNSDGTGEMGVRIFGYDPSWSPDGRWIAYTEWGDRSFPSELHRVRPDGSGDRPLVRLPRLAATAGAWTGTGAIIFTTVPPVKSGTDSAADGELWQVDAQGRALHPLAPQCIFGTSRSDRINGTRLADRVYALEGNDVVNVRGRGRDRVDCGPGRDTVLADRVDLVRNCERIVR